MPPVIDRSQCSGCGTCAAICPTQVFRHDPHTDKVPQTPFAEECWHCNSCVLDCPRGAIRLRVPLPYMMLHVDATELRPE